MQRHFQVLISIIPVRKLDRLEITPVKVTQGQTYLNDEVTWAAQNAVDRDLSTESSTSTADGAGWLQLELGATKVIFKIVVYYRFYTNWYNPDFICVQNEEEFKACVDSDTNVDVSVYQGEIQQKSCGTLQLTYGLEQSDQIYTLICSIEGDTVKLSEDTGFIAFAEVVLIGTGK